MTPLLGAHVSVGSQGIFRELEARNAEVAQVFMGPPNRWSPANKTPIRGEGVHLWTIPVYVHAPYLVNLASPHPVTRSRSVACVNYQMRIAAGFGAAGLVVDGGLCGGGTVQHAIDLWADSLSRLSFEVPLIIENAANGQESPARTLDHLARLWKVAGQYPDVGLCIDTCHAHAAGLPIRGLYSGVMEATGRLDLIHANGSLSALGSGRDKHTNLFDSAIPIDDIVDLIAESSAPVILETPAGLSAQVKELRILRERLAERLQLAPDIGVEEAGAPS